jgi:hypothetical protein
VLRAVAHAFFRARGHRNSFIKEGALEGALMGELLGRESKSMVSSFLSMVGGGQNIRHPAMLSRGDGRMIGFQAYSSA